jgi:hypothetical protein
LYAIGAVSSAIYIEFKLVGQLTKASVPQGPLQRDFFAKDSLRCVVNIATILMIHSALERLRG